MYYKIVNKECEVFKNLHELRTKELQIEKDNKEAIAEKTGLEYRFFLGHVGQQNFRRVTQYTGFTFIDPEKVNLKIWERHINYSDVFIPNRKTKLGREMYQFISNGLKSSNFMKPIGILGLEHPDRFSLPFIHVVGEVIVLFLDNKMEPKDENVIEITKREFEEFMCLES